MGWTKTLPVTGTNAATTPVFYQGNWDALDNWFIREHKSLTDASSGKHLLGIVGVMAESTTSGVTALSTTPGSGSLAFDTTVGAWLFNGAGSNSAWKTVHRWLPTTRVYAYVSTDYNPTSGGATVVTYDTEDTDSLGELSSYVFSAKEAGYFLVHAKVLVKTDTAAGGDALTLSLSGSSGLFRTSPVTTQADDYQSLEVSTIAEIASGGTIAALITAPSNKTTTISGGAGCSYIRIHRVS